MTHPHYSPHACQLNYIYGQVFVKTAKLSLSDIREVAVVKWTPLHVYISAVRGISFAGKLDTQFASKLVLNLVV